MGYIMDDETRIKALKPLACLEGQLRGIMTMVEYDRYCIDIMRQVQAVKPTLTGLEGLVLKDQLQSCVETALRSDDIVRRREKMEKLVAVLGGYKK